MLGTLSRIASVLYFAFLTLLVAESVSMALLAWLIPQDEGWVVAAAIWILPAWAVLISVVFLIEKRWRFSLILWAVFLGTSAILYFSRAQ